MKAENIYPRVFFSKEESERLSQVEADLWPYILKKRTQWMQGANVDKEWDAFVKELDRLGMQDWLNIKQTGYNRAKQ
ncbi:hypothetical protein D3C77_651450 [compost metagenome]